MYAKGRKIGMNIAVKLKKKLTDSDDKHDQVSGLASSSESLDMRHSMSSQKQSLAKSTSLGSVKSEASVEQNVDHDGIISLTQNVKLFSDGLAKLKQTFSEPLESGEELKVKTHERLAEVLYILKNILSNYTALQSTELYAASGALISKVKNLDYSSGPSTALEQTFSDAIDQLALAFSSSVSEYLMGDADASFQDKESCDDLLSSSKDAEDMLEAENRELNAEDIDSSLCRLHSGLDVALQRAKAWSKYMKDISTYIERKAQLESEFSKKLSHLAQLMKPILTDEGFLPLQSVYCTVLSQDKDYASTCQATQTLLQTSKFVGPLTSRRLEHDKIRKAIKDQWIKEVKKMQDAEHSLRKAQSMYVQRQQEYEKAREQSSKVESDMLSQSSSSALSKVDKRRKMEEDASMKAAEAETTYKACVAEANHRKIELEKTKFDLLSRIREQILMCDQCIKDVTLDYFHLLQTVTTPIPIQFHTLSETTRQYEPGVQYLEFVRRLPMTDEKSGKELFTFEPYSSVLIREIDNRKTSTQSTGSSGLHSQESSPRLLGHRKEHHRSPVKAWGTSAGVESDTDSASGSSKSLDSSPLNSPQTSGHRKLGVSTSLDGLDDTIEDEKNLLSIPGSEGSEVRGIVRPHLRKRRNTTFGVDFQQQVEQCKSAVPPIVTKCLAEIEKRGITFEGIYRKSGVKSKVEGLCQRFDRDPETIDLSDEHPNVISNVLKLYLRQLPEPLLTYKLYSHFITAAKEHSQGSTDKEDTVKSLKGVVKHLPYSNGKTTALLMHHLHRVAACTVNQMIASNLGIVFGPTLLRPIEGTSSLACLVDMPHQARAVELLITYAKDIFGPETDYEVVPGETPVEHLGGDGAVTTTTASPQATVATTSSVSSAVPSVTEKSTTVAVSSVDSKTSQGKSSLTQNQPTTSSVAGKPGDVLQPPEQENESDVKSSLADFELPGTAHSEIKDNHNPPHVTVSEGLAGDVDSPLYDHDTNDDVDDDDDDDGDLPDTLLPDDSKPFVSNSVLCPADDALKEDKISETDQRVSQHESIGEKVCPPGALPISSPDSTKKMAVPTINIIDSSPVAEKSVQNRFTSVKGSEKEKPADSANEKKDENIVRDTHIQTPLLGKRSTSPYSSSSPSPKSFIPPIFGSPLLPRHGFTVGSKPLSYRDSKSCLSPILSKKLEKSPAKSTTLEALPKPSEEGFLKSAKSSGNDTLSPKETTTDTPIVPPSLHKSSVSQPLMSKSIQNILPSHGSKQATASPTLSRKSLSMFEHSPSKSGRISPRPLSSPLMFRHSATSPTLGAGKAEKKDVFTYDIISSEKKPLFSLGNSLDRGDISVVQDKDRPKLGQPQCQKSLEFSTANPDLDNFCPKTDDQNKKYGKTNLFLSPASFENSSSSSSRSFSSDTDMSMTSASDVSPEILRKSSSLPRKAASTMAPGWPDFSPILPRQKDLSLKRSLGNLSAVDEYPLSGNLCYRGGKLTGSNPCLGSPTSKPEFSMKKSVSGTAVSSLLYESFEKQPEIGSSDGPAAVLDESSSLSNPKSTSSSMQESTSLPSSPSSQMKLQSSKDEPAGFGVQNGSKDMSSSSDAMKYSSENSEETLDPAPTDIKALSHTRDLKKNDNFNAQLKNYVIKPKSVSTDMSNKTLAECTEKESPLQNLPKEPANDELDTKNRTHPQTSKVSTPVTVTKVTRGPLGIVMGKAAIMPARSNFNKQAKALRSPGCGTKMPHTPASKSAGSGHASACKSAVGVPSNKSKVDPVSASNVSSTSSGSDSCKHASDADSSTNKMAVSSADDSFSSEKESETSSSSTQGVLNIDKLSDVSSRSGSSSSGAKSPASQKASLGKVLGIKGIGAVQKTGKISPTPGITRASPTQKYSSSKAPNKSPPSLTTAQTIDKGQAGTSPTKKTTASQIPSSPSSKPASVPCTSCRRRKSTGSKTTPTQPVTLTAYRKSSDGLGGPILLGETTSSSLADCKVDTGNKQAKKSSKPMIKKERAPFFV